MARFKTIKKQREYIYDDIDEFRKYRNGTKVHEDWRSAPEGEWCLTDDDQVLRMLKRGSMGKSEYVRTVLGTFDPARKLLMVGDPPKNIYSFGSTMYPDEFVAKKDRLTYRERLFAHRVANGEHPTDAYLDVYRTTNSKYAKIRARKLMRTSRVMGVISKEIKTALDDIGIDEHYLLSGAKEIIDGEDVKNSDKIRALELLMKITNMFPKESKTESLTVFQGFSREHLAALESDNMQEITDGQRESTS